MKALTKILLLVLSLASVLSNLRTLEDLKETITVKPNEIFTIKLYSNPSTGYSWQMEKDENSSVFTFIKQEKEITKEDLEIEKKKPRFILVGRGSNYIYTFKAGSTSNQVGTLTMIYKRSWLKEYSKKIEYTIKVE